MKNGYQWERHTGGLKECWNLRHYHQYLGAPASSVIGTIRKQKNKHPCRKWIVAAVKGWDFNHVCVLDDMNRRDALEAAKMILLSLKDST